MTNKLSDLKDNWDDVYDKIKSSSISSTIEVLEEDPLATFKKLEFINGRFLSIPNQAIKNLTPIYNLLSNRLRCFGKDCDGIIITEKEGRLFIILVELKSSFSTENISDARYQIISAYIKIKMLLSIIEEYNSKEIIFKSIIVSHELEPNKITNIASKAQLKEEDSNGSKFASKLYFSGQTDLNPINSPGVKLKGLNPEIKLNKLPLYYLKTNKHELSVDINKFI